MGSGKSPKGEYNDTRINVELKLMEFLHLSISFAQLLTLPFPLGGVLPEDVYDEVPLFAIESPEVLFVVFVGIKPARRSRIVAVRGQDLQFYRNWRMFPAHTQIRPSFLAVNLLRNSREKNAVLVMPQPYDFSFYLIFRLEGALHKKVEVGLFVFEEALKAIEQLDNFW